MQELDKTIRHCSMVGLARKEGRIFYSTAVRHECNGGAWALGLREITESLKNGEFYYKLGKFESSAACKRTIDRVPHLQTLETYATLYAPLEKTPFDPQVVLIIASPWVMLKLAQSVLFRIGGRINAEFAGIQSVCSDACAQTYLNGQVNFSLGCDGSRKFSGNRGWRDGDRDSRRIAHRNYRITESCCSSSGIKTWNEITAQIISVIFSDLIVLS